MFELPRELGFPGRAPPSRDFDVVAGAHMPIASATCLRRAWITLIVVGTVAYFFWTVLVMPGGPPRIRGDESDHFNLLSRGFRNGHLHLAHPVPAELLNAPNPYDPALRRAGVPLLYDASFFQGKYYVYFGPAPVVTLLLPFRLLSGRDLPLPYAVWLYCTIGYLALVGSFLFLQRRYFARAHLLTVTAALVGLGGASMLTAVLRRPHMWELAIASGFAFFSLSLFCLVRAIHAVRPMAWAVAGGIALGFAVASRPTYLLCSVLFALPWLWNARDRANPYNWRTVVGAGIGCGVPVLALLTYNYARFGDALEFGQKYQLTGIIESEARHFSASYWWFNLRAYFLAPLRWTNRFPFVDGIDVPAFPPGFGGHEYSFGILPNLPFAFFSLMSLLAWWRGGSAAGATRLLWLSIAVFAGAASINAVLLLSYFGNCIRYMADFTPYLMFLAAVGVLLGEAGIKSRKRWNTWVGGAGILALFSSMMAAAGVVRFYESASGGYPFAYRSIARALDSSALWMREQRSLTFGPKELELSFPANRQSREETLLAVRQRFKDVATVFVEYRDGHQVRLGYREMGDSRPVAYSGLLNAPPGARHKLELSLGDASSTAKGPGGRLRARLDNVPVWDAPVVSFDAYAGLFRRGVDAAPGASGIRFSGEIHAMRPATFPPSPALSYSGIRTRITLRPEMAGRSYPLITTGRMKAADFLILEVHPDHQISFAYDHWGQPLITSPKIPAAQGETRVVEFWVPALSPPGNLAPLLVKVDDAIVWEKNVPAYPITTDRIFPGANLIGGSNCDRLLVNAVFEETELPRPAK